MASTCEAEPYQRSGQQMHDRLYQEWKPMSPMSGKRLKTRAGARSPDRANANQRKSRKRSKPSKPVDIIIRRSSGRKEDLSEAKMAQTISRSGVPYPAAGDVASTIYNEVVNESVEIAGHVEEAKTRPKEQTEPRKVVVDGEQLRRRVGEELRGAETCTTRRQVLRMRQ